MSKQSMGERLANIRVGRFRYNSPWTQVALVGFVCFCSVGMFAAITGLGAGGTQDVITSDISNSVLYGVFAFSGFFAGSFNNIFGPRLTLSFGTTGYSLYIGSLWAYQLHGSKPFLIVAGGILGFTAAMLWAAQGAIMLSYPMEQDKGRAFSLFWSIFQMGAVVGASITLGMEANSESVGAVSTGVYLAFLIIMLTAIVTSWLILPPNYVVRGDGTIVELDSALTPRQEIAAFSRLFKDWRMLALFPMFFTSNFFYSYQSSIVAYMFVPRGRALASFLTNLGAVFGAVAVGMALDYSPGNRRKRAIYGWILVLFLQMLVWSGGLAWQVQFTRKEGGELNMDWHDSRSAGVFTLLFAYYFADAAYQGLAYYIMGSVSSSSFRLARMSGYYKGVQSAGAAVSFGIDAVHTPYLHELIACWAMVLFSLPLALGVIWKTRETDEEREGRGQLHIEDVPEGRRPSMAVPPSVHRLSTVSAMSREARGDYPGDDIDKGELRRYETAYETVKLDHRQ